MQAQTAVPVTPSTPHPGRSTGPRTPEGKARASQNALKHGLFSEALVIRGEAPEDFDSYQAEMIAAHKPYDLPEQEQLEVMVMMKWKLRRLWRQEPRLYGIYEAKAGQPDPDGAQALFDDSEHKRLAFTRLTRQEAGWMRAYDKAGDRLRLLRDQRIKHLRQVGPALGAGDPMPVSAPRRSAESRNAEKTERTPPVGAVVAEAAPVGAETQVAAVVEAPESSPLADAAD